MKFKTLLSVLVTSVLFCHSQNQTKKWYFGQTAGLSFLTTPPTFITSALTTQEGCSSISDAAGNTLMYTDGLTVYNQNNAVMTGGTGLLGNGSTTQSGVIVKQPGNNNIYYIFTQGAVGGPLNYSTVDMSLSGGLGAVTVLNTPLFPTCTEKLTSAKHCNGVDFWVISHEKANNNFRVYLVTSAGVNPTPVISSVGSVHTGDIGYLKASPNGRKLGMGIYGTNTFELYDFDPSTGVVSNQLILANLSSPYGVEFSPDGSKFYGDREGFPGVLYQWDLCAGSNAAIVASQYTIATAPGITLYGMQIGADGKIYVCRYMQQSLAVINNPNAAGAACNFVDVGINISPGVCRLGLPNFITSYFDPPAAPFTFTSTGCATTSFSAPAISSSTMVGCSAAGSTVTGMLWDFGEPASGAANSSTLSNPTHNYNSISTFTVKLILYYNCKTDTLVQTVTPLNIAPTFTISGKLEICRGQTTTLTATGVTNYTWSPANMFTFQVGLSPTVTTIYTVTGKNQAGCVTTRTVQVIVNPCTGIAEQNVDSFSSLYPNPGEGQFYIETTLMNATFTIYDQLGVPVKAGKIEEHRQLVDAADLANGIYIVELRDNKARNRLKLVKTD